MNEFDLKDLCRDVANDTDLTADKVQEVFNNAFYHIAKNVAANDRVEFHQIGVFRKRYRAARKSVLKGVEYAIPEHSEIEFIAAPAYVELLNAELGEESPAFVQ